MKIKDFNITKETSNELVRTNDNNIVSTTMKINNVPIVLEAKGNNAFTDSLTIAKVFGKEHKNVLQAIRNIEDFDALISELKIQPRDYKDSRGKKTSLILTR